MSKYLRRIDDQSIWLYFRNDNYQNYDWLTSNEDIPADPLTQLKPIKESQLSLYLIHDKNSNLNQVLAAIGANLTGRHAYYILIDDSHVKEYEFKIEKSDGNTHDRQVNKEWHFDLKELSGIKLVTLAKLFLDKGEFEVCLEVKMIDLINQSILGGTMNKKRMHANLLKKLDAN